MFTVFLKSLYTSTERNLSTATTAKVLILTSIYFSVAFITLPRLLINVNEQSEDQKQRINSETWAHVLLSQGSLIRHTSFSNQLIYKNPKACRILRLSFNSLFHNLSWPLKILILKFVNNTYIFHITLF